MILIKSMLKKLKKDDAKETHHYTNLINQQLDQRSFIQRSRVDFNDCLMRNINEPTQLILDDEAIYKEGITDDVYMMNKAGSAIILLTRKGKVFVYNEDKWSLEIDVNGEFVVDMEVSAINVILKTRSGNLYGASVYNSWNQVGNESNSPSFSSLVFEKVKSSVELLDAKTGYGHTYFVSKDRELYFCGNLEFGQMAHNPSDIYSVISEATRISSNGINGKRVKLIASGYAHCLAVFEDGSGLVWGNNDREQLGYDGPESMTTPKPLKIPSKNEIIGISAGQNISLVLTSAYEIFISGSFMGKSDVWRKIKVIDDEFPPQSIIDAYIINNDIYVLSKSKFFFIILK